MGKEGERDKWEKEERKIREEINLEERGQETIKERIGKRERRQGKRMKKEEM